MKEGRLKVGDGELSWSASGSGAPLILIHGFSFDSAMWDPQVPALEEGFTVIRYDLRGFGRSSRPAGPYDHAADLQAVIAALAPTPPVLVGLSLGANVAIEHAVRFPGAARGLVLASAGLPGHVWKTERPPEAIKAHSDRHGVEAAKTYWIAHPIYETLRRIPAARAVLEAMVGRYDGWHWLNTDPRPVAGLAQHLPSITVPTLVISGDHDDPGYREIAQRLAAEIPHARLERFADSGHLLNLEEPERFNRLVVEFAEGLAGA